MWENAEGAGKCEWKHSAPRGREDGFPSFLFLPFSLSSQIIFPGQGRDGPMYEEVWGGGVREYFLSTGFFKKRVEALPNDFATVCVQIWMGNLCLRI